VTKNEGAEGYSQTARSASTHDVGHARVSMVALVAATPQRRSAVGLRRARRRCGLFRGFSSRAIRGNISRADEVPTRENRLIMRRGRARTHHRRRALTVAAIALASFAASSLPRAAEAQATLQMGPGIETGLDTRVQWIPRMPTMRANQLDAGYRTFDGQEVPSVGAEQMIGFGGEFGIAASDRWVVHVLGFSTAFTFGARPRVLSSLDGSIVTQDAWKSGDIAMTFGGLEYRWKHRRWMFQLGARMGVSIAWMPVHVAQGASTTDTVLAAASFLIRGDAAICRRLDPENRLCVFVQPSIYEFGLFDGGSAGLRLEYGL
jgi:hypothetical protein